MTRTFADVSPVVRDYDKAIAFCTDALGFDVIEDTPLGDGKCWVVDFFDLYGNRRDLVETYDA